MTVRLKLLSDLKSSLASKFSLIIASTEQGRSREFLSMAGPNIFHYDSTSARNHSNRGVPPLAAPPSRIARRPFFSKICEWWENNYVKRQER